MLILNVEPLATGKHDARHLNRCGSDSLVASYSVLRKIFANTDVTSIQREGLTAEAGLPHKVDRLWCMLLAQT